MNEPFAATLLSVTRGPELDVSEWRRVVGELLNGLRRHLGEGFEVDPEPSFFGDAFSVWIFGDAPRGDPAPAAWSGFLSGRVIDPGSFRVDLAQFMFDAGARTRIRTAEGSYLVHSFDVREGEVPTWRALGWRQDEYEEWEDVPYPEEE